MSARLPVTGRLPIIAFVAFVVLACGPDRDWHLKATVSGPKQALPGQVLTLVIDASYHPQVTIKSTQSAEPYWGCRAEWTGRAQPCTLPPGAALDAVTTTGHCGGLGCDSDAKTCPPPSKQFARVTSQSVPFWSVTPRREASITISPMRVEAGARATPQIEVVLDVGQSESQARLRVETLDGKPVELDRGERPESCGRFYDPAPEIIARRAMCVFRLREDVKAPTPLHLTAEATIFGPCPYGASSCAAPSPAPSIVSITLRE